MTKTIEEFTYKTTKNPTGDSSGYVGTCIKCNANIRRYENKIKYHRRKKVKQMLEQVKTRVPMSNELELKIIEENKQLRLDNAELMRQVEILIPMVHKDARKMYYEMNPHMDKFRDPNAGKPFKVENIATGVVVGTFTNVAMVAEELDVHASRIQSCLKGRTDSACGHIFYYLND